MLARVEQHPNGPRLWIGGKRVHHFHFGALLIIFGARLVWVDRSDLPKPKRARLEAGPSIDPEIGHTTSTHGGSW